MYKLIRYSAAALLSLSMAAGGMITAYADEAADYSNVGPGFESPAPAADDTGSGTVIIRTDSDSQEQAAQEETAEQTQPEITFSTDEEAAMRAYNRSQEFGESVVYIGASAMRQDGTWTPSFVGDDTIHNRGDGWYSMQMILRNTLGNLIYRTYSSTTGWSPWVMNGAETAHLTDGSRVEAVQVRLAGVVSNDYDIYYCATLSDGTTLDWAHNGQTAGSMAEGKWLIGFRMTLVPKTTQFPYSTAKPLSAPAGTDGVQFNTGGLPTYKDGSGNPYTGWGWVNNQRYYFVNDQAVTGWQYIDGYKYFFDDYGMLVSDLRNILGDAGPYMLKINRVTDTVTVYAQDGANGYVLPVVSFVATTGDDTPEGTFQIPEKYRWRLMFGDVYTQYAMRITGSYMLHSVIFNQQDKYSLDASTYNNLGVGRSHGCTRLKTGEMKWVYDNCPVGTTVIIYDSEINGPFEAPVLDATIPADQNYDPTDPTVPEAVAAMEAAAAAQAQQTAQAINDAQAAAQAQQAVPMPSEPIN